MKRIVISVTNNLNYDQRMHRIAKTLSENYRVLLVGTNTRSPEPLEALSYETHRLNLWFNRGFLFYLEYNIRLFLFLLFRQVDLLYAVDLDSLLANRLNRFGRRKLIFDAHEFFTELPELEGRNYVRKVWQRIAHFGIPKADCCITVAEPLAKKLEQRYRCKFHTVRNMPYFRPNTSGLNKGNENNKLLIYQGAMNVGRGLEQCVEAMQSLSEYQLLLVGEGPMLSRLQELASSMQLDNVLFKGALAPDELHKLTPKAYLGLNLLDNSSLNYYYSLANKFFDYTLAQVPAIHMDFPCYQDMLRIHDVGYLLQELDSKSLVDLIRSIEQDSLNYAMKREACQQAAQEWNWEQESLKLNTLVKQQLVDKGES